MAALKGVARRLALPVGVGSEEDVQQVVWSLLAQHGASQAHEAGACSVIRCVVRCSKCALVARYAASVVLMHGFQCTGCSGAGVRAASVLVSRPKQTAAGCQAHVDWLAADDHIGCAYM